MLVAERPVTSTSSPVPATAAGMTSSRSDLIRSVVASSCGPVVGTRFMRYAWGAAGSSGSAGVTAATPGVRASVRCSSTTAPAGSPVDSEGPGTAVIRNGPLKPSPKASAVRS